MFKFLKEKLKKAVSKFSKDVEAEAEDIEEPVVEEKAEEPKPEPAKKEKPEKKKVEEEEKEEAVPEISAELAGLKESLETYSEEELDSIMNILGFPAKAKKKNRDAKINSILTKPLLEINSAIEKLEAIEEVPEAEKPEEKEAEREEKIEEAVEEKKEEEVLEQVEEKAEELEEEHEEKKEGFFKKLFRRKKEEEIPEEKEEKIEEAPPAPPVIEEEKVEKKEIEEELEKVEKEKEEVEKRIEEEEKELEAREEKVEEKAEPEKEEKKKGIFGRIKEGFVLKKLSEPKFESIFFELEVALLENNVAVEVIDKIKNDLRDKLVEKKIRRSEIEKMVGSSLKESLDQIMSTEQLDILKEVKARRKENKPYVIVFVGINGSGKTTTIAKIAKYFMNNGLKSVMVASDTFRAAAIQQLEEHANKLGVKIIKHDYGSDPAAVAFDGIKYAESKDLDVVLIDTAGRLHSNVNLMDEMKKIIRISKPDMKIFVGESITGNDCIEQAQQFNKAIDVDGIVLSKADVDEKGGAAISVSYVTGKPILFLGTGQTYDSLQKFEKNIVLGNLGLV